MTEKIQKEEFARLVTYMKDNYGINLEAKLSLVEGRLWTMLKRKGFSSLGEYFQYVVSDPSGQEAKTLVSKLTTNYTYFMREDQHYRFLRETVLPRLTAAIPDKDLRIWSAGCSSGEEPYTLAMVLNEYFGPGKAAWDAKILATDISPPMLQQAQRAVYPGERLQNVSPAWRERYFTKVGEDEYQVGRAIHDEVVVRSFNLMEKTFPFKKKFHVIFCRNVMIYFDRATREALVRRYYDALMPGGYFFIGMSETLNKEETPFDFVQPSIYRKKG